jgi:hypothetical protein
MVDQVLKKAMERRDEALREVERWENWVKAYVELTESSKPHEVPLHHSASPLADELDIAPALRQPDVPAEGSKGRGSWLRNGNAPN